MKLFTLESDRLDPVQPTTLGAEWQRQDLQRILSRNIDVVEKDLLVIAADYGDWEDSRPRIDLLAIDRQANFVVIGVERPEAGAQAELHVLGCAAMISSMTVHQAVAAYRRYLADQVGEVDAEQAMLDFLGWEDLDDELFGGDVRIVLVAQDFSRELWTTVTWLLARDVDIRCVRLCPYRLGDQVLVDVHQVIPQPEASGSQASLPAQTKATAKTKAKAKTKTKAKAKAKTKETEPEMEPQTRERDDRGHDDRDESAGPYYVNVDDGNGRRWEDCRRLRFIVASGGRRQIDALRELRPGDLFYAYQTGKGYVGLGKVVDAAVPVIEFRDGSTPILAGSLRDPSIGADADDPDLCAWLARVEWTDTVPSSGAFWQEEMFADQNVACRLRDEATLQLLAEQFSERTAARRRAAIV